MVARGQDGFTLVEVLTSLLIFSTAILGLMHAGTENIRAVNVIEQKQTAGIIADNQLILAMNSEQILRPGVTEETLEMNGRDWDWEIRIEDTEQPNFVKLTVYVREKDQEQIILSRVAFADIASQQ